MSNVDLKRLFEKIKGKANVIGYSATLKPRIRGGKVIDGEQCFRVYVSKKLPIPLLKAEDVIPREIEGIPVDVVEIGVISAPPRGGKKGELKPSSLPPKITKQRPLVAGVSIGHYKITAGTLGWYVESNGTMYMLSNNHVFANENKAEIGDPIVQQGMYDIYDKENWEQYICGRLYKFIPINFNEYTCPYRRAVVNLLRKLKLVKKAEPNKVDCAIAEITVPYELKFIDVETPVQGVNYELKLNDKVQKTGRTTCWTKDGVVVDFNWCGYVAYSRGYAWFEDQILIEKAGFSDGGDSGSLIMDENFNAVGLLFAGSETHTVANKIKHVEDALQVKIVKG